MTKQFLGIPETEWFRTIFGGAVFGGIFWMILSARTTFFEATGPTHGLPFALAVAVGVAITGGLIHLIPNGWTKSLGVVVALGALLGLPVLGYFAIVNI